MRELLARIPNISKNFAYNSDLGIWQRGTTITSQTGLDVNYFLADRISHRFEASGGTADNTMQRFADVPNVGFRYSARIASGGAAASSAIISNYFRQTYEKWDARELLKLGAFAVGFFYKSNKVGLHTVSFDCAFGWNGSGLAQAKTFNVTQADTWKYYEVFFDGIVIVENGAIAENAAGLLLNIGPTGAGLGQTEWNSGDNAYMTGLVVNPGKKVSNWNLRGGSLGLEANLAQRYYFRLTNGSGLNKTICSGVRVSSVRFIGVFYYPVEMRAIPSPGRSAVSDLQISTGVSTAQATSFGTREEDVRQLTFDVGTGAAGTGAEGANLGFDGGAASTAYIDLNAEL